jgi:hypothetical protein
MQKKIETIQVRGGEGAGDVVYHLNLAHAWSALNDLPVELEVHWRYDANTLYHPEDQETITQRYDLMHEKMFENHRVYMRHVRSDLFSLVDEITDQEERRKARPPRVLFPNTKVVTVPPKFNWIMPFGDVGCASWKWKDEKTPKNKIVVWTPKKNREDIKNYKRQGDLKVENWDQLLTVNLPSKFPDYEIVELTYRDSFLDAYDHIREAAFCVGYDGMWHLVARNFGVPYLTATGSPDLAITTTPHGIIFRQIKELWKFINEEMNLAHMQEAVEKKHKDHLGLFRCGI